MKLRCRIPLATFELNIDVMFDARVTAIFGPSGSGKTTLLDAIAGLRDISDGEIEIDGRVLFSSARGIDLPPRQRDVGYVPQEGALFPHLSVRRNIAFGAERKTDTVMPISMDHVLEILEISHLADRPIAKLSGGEAQRVALARAILSHPRLLLLDEPLAALDIGLKEKILPYLGRVRDEFHIPMIYVTHNLTEVLTLADWVLMIGQGRLLAQGVPKDVLRSPATIAQIDEEQLENVLTVVIIEPDGLAGRTRVRLESGQELFVPYIARSAGQPLQVRISPGDILISTERPKAISAANIISGSIRSIETSNGQAMIALDAGAEFYVRLTASAVERLKLIEELPVFLIMKTHSFRIL
ncbi:MAG TPA: molybdenum ABC transporter ATP-binding protein [Candidatus Polarisedimenticolaceae bacterium]|nr:molybdenum ABC transporter ATP-binding protein [Candidatus Polarisedimenticolaceae bacterium]